MPSIKMRVENNMFLTNTQVWTRTLIRARFQQIRFQKHLTIMELLHQPEAATCKFSAQTSPPLPFICLIPPAQASKPHVGIPRIGRQHESSTTSLQPV